MYIHLGNGAVVSGKNIVGIFDIENTTTGKNTGLFLEKVTREGRVVNVTLEMPKSFVLCMENGKEVVYISQISAATLRKRSRKSNLPAM